MCSQFLWLVGRTGVGRVGGDTYDVIHLLYLDALVVWVVRKVW